MAVEMHKRERCTLVRSPAVQSLTPVVFSIISRLTLYRRSPSSIFAGDTLNLAQYVGSELVALFYHPFQGMILYQFVRKKSCYLFLWGLRVHSAVKKRE
ncbi:unnamed protein product [Trifolium pratense]|uniref:Uncharacterized protein n=1 Tax=Trifolium pratense TaxID=57577 RepID=A0ACB0M056_TRIPR|nr:unnamed protein product [Trifolium pratense]